MSAADHFGQEVDPFISIAARFALQSRIVIRQRIRQSDLAAIAGVARNGHLSMLN
jgi:hypothetical protein